MRWPAAEKRSPLRVRAYAGGPYDAGDGYRQGAPAGSRHRCPCRHAQLRTDRRGGTPDRQLRLAPQPFRPLARSTRGDRRPFHPGGGGNPFGRSAGTGRPGRRPGRITCERIEGDGATLVEATHDGYVRAFGLVHRRRLYLADNGDDLRGEDTLEGPAGCPFALRFHLHPSVTPTPVAGGDSVLLKLPSGAVWRLRATGAVLEVFREHLPWWRVRRWRRAAPDQSGRRDRRHRVQFHRDQMGATSREVTARDLKLSNSFTQGFRRHDRRSHPRHTSPDLGLRQDRAHRFGPRARRARRRDPLDRRHGQGPRGRRPAGEGHRRPSPASPR